MKKRIVMLTLAVATALSVTGCGAKESDTLTVDKPTASVVDLSSNWKDMQFILGDKLYKVPFDYIELASEGWSYENASETVNDSAKQLSVKLMNPFFNNNTSVGIVNNSGKTTDGTNCKVFRFEMNVKDTLAIDEIRTAGGLRWGSSLTEILSAWGTPSSQKDLDVNTVKLNYYDPEKNISVDLTVDKNSGLLGVNFEDNSIQ